MNDARSVITTLRGKCLALAFLPLPSGERTEVRGVITSGRSNVTPTQRFALPLTLSLSPKGRGNLRLLSMPWSGVPFSLVEYAKPTPSYPVSSGFPGQE